MERPGKGKGLFPSFLSLIAGHSFSASVPFFQKIFMNRLARQLFRFTLLAGAAAQTLANEPFVRHYEGVLGSTLDITVYHDDLQAAEQAANAAVAEIARLEQVLSHYRADSELSQLNNMRATDEASADLLAIVQHCAHWQQNTDGKFSCRLGALQGLWREAEKSQSIPDRAAVRAQARALNQAELRVDAARTFISMGEGIILDPNALATGYIVDQAMAQLRQQLPRAQAIKLDAGGDAFYWGTPPGQQGWQVGIADPLNPADTGALLGSLHLSSKAVTASGHVNRKRTIARREFSHILQARDGWPVENGTAAVVVADNALTADAVATTLAVQALGEGIDWVNTLDGVEALVIDSGGHQLSSDGWNALLAGNSDDAGAADAALGSGDSFVLDYMQPEFDVAGYNRPYIAIWITDTAQNPRKNLLLLGDNERWARENTRWWRRVGRRNPALLDGVARPTRAPGQHQLQWDGRDDFGKPLTEGLYELHLEAAREGGGSSYQKVPFSWGSGDVQVVEIPADGELGSIKLQISPVP
jgi:thiamine biosynthesis lipoprotein